MRTLLLSVLGLVSVSAAAEPAVSLDRGFSPRAVLEQLRKAPAPASVAGTPKRTVRWIPGWKDVVMQPGQTESERFSLASTEIREDCTFDHRGGMQCRETFGHTNREWFKLVFKDRPQVPGAEKFTITLDGYYLTVRVQQVFASYDLAREGERLVFTPRRDGKQAPPVPPVPVPSPGHPGRCSTDGDCPPGTRCNFGLGMCVAQ